ncbi:MAG: hypothetical protein V7K40_11225 [Nostoc sp.]
MSKPQQQPDLTLCELLESFTPGMYEIRTAMPGFLTREIRVNLLHFRNITSFNWDV